MARPEILKYLGMDQEGFKSVLCSESPPIDAMRAAIVLKFMDAYHLSDPVDGFKQYMKLRESQANLLGLRSDERQEFMEGFED